MGAQTRQRGGTQASHGSTDGYETQNSCLIIHRDEEDQYIYVYTNTTLLEIHKYYTTLHIYIDEIDKIDTQYSQIIIQYNETGKQLFGLH